MKKSILGLLLASCILMLSSCIIYADDVVEEHFHYYDFTLVNDTDYRLADWYLRAESGRKEAKSSDFVTVYPRSSSKLHNVKEDSYRVMIAYSSDPFQYYYSDLFYLDCDKKYYLIQYTFYTSRNADGTITEKPCIQLADEDGNKLELILSKDE